MGTDQQLENFIYGFLMPMAFALVLQKGWSSTVKQIVTFALYITGALFIFILRNEGLSGLDWRGYFDVFVPVIIGGVTGYFALWSKTVAKPVEETTSL